MFFDSLILFLDTHPKEKQTTVTWYKMWRGSTLKNKNWLVKLPYIHSMKG